MVGDRSDTLAEATPWWGRWIDSAVRVACVVSFAVYASVLAWASPDVKASSQLVRELFNVPFALAAIACWRAGQRGGSGASAWKVLAVAFGVYLAGNQYALRFVGPDQYPSPADALWLLSYGLMVGGLVLLARSTVVGITVSALLDGLIAGAASAALAASILDRLLHVPPDRWTVVATNLAYPVADLLLVGVLVTTTKLIGRVDRARILLALGFLLLFVGDCIFLWHSAEGAWVLTSAPDVLFVGAATVVCLAAGTVRPGEAIEAASPHLTLPAVGAAVCVGVLIWGQGTHRGPVAATLAAFGLLLVGVRVALVVGDLRRRAASAAVDPERLAQVDEVRCALRDGQIVAHFQPLIDLRTNEVVGAEALARWHHPTRGVVSPAEFLPLVVEGRLMGRLTESMLRQATSAGDLLAEAGRPLGLSVNISAPELGDPALVAMVGSLASRSRASSRRLTLEITEESVLGDPSVVGTTLENLRAHGVRISVDDYGAGHTTLAYLRDLPLDEVKLDRSFVRGAWDDDRASKIAASTVQLAHQLELTMVAEGIEDQETNDWLTSLDYDIGQGNFHARPMPLDDLLVWLGERSTDDSRRDDLPGAPG